MTRAHLAYAYVPKCRDCGAPLPAWLQLVLALVAVAIAMGVLYGISRLLERRGGRRAAVAGHPSPDDAPAGDDLPALVDRGLRMLAERERAAPAQAVHTSIRGQLEHLRAVLRAGQAPDEQTLDRLTLGLLAAREFDTSDPAFADVLFEINYRANRYAPTT